MEKIVNRQKGTRGDKRRNISFIFTSPSTLFREYENGHLSSILNGGNATNAVRHGMPRIHFLATKRLMRKRSVRVALQDVSLYPQTALAPLDKQSGRLDRNHSVLIGQRSEIKQQRIIHND